ncbi:hypothetical protein BLNAU_22824 [Blattamonas nauphoetae]|uniref:Uncharacterized protein n=1 Tax=Blattamonas nauphoetae TaxID=2049346 RepID=A0ABQ9WRZ8_9EUKA|nr:hypothetical protein BLNAU_22824 [Blattamonas nauphoetae]
MRVKIRILHSHRARHSGISRRAEGGVYECHTTKGAADQQTITYWDGHFVVVDGVGLMKDGMTDKASSFRPLANTGSAVIPIDTDWISQCPFKSIVSKSSFSETLTSTAIHFAAGTDASSATSLVDSSLSSLAIVDTKDDVSSLTCFFTEVLFSVKANTLSAPFVTLSKVLFGVRGMTSQLDNVIAGVLTLTNTGLAQTATSCDITT